MSRPIDQRIIRLTLDNSGVVTEGKATKSLMAGVLESIRSLGASGGAKLSGLTNAISEVNQEFRIMETVVFGALTKVGGWLASLGGRIVSDFISPISQGWAEFDSLLGSQQQIMVNSGRSIEELQIMMERLQQHANRSTAAFSEMVYMTNALAASPWVDWYSLDDFIIGFQTLAYLMASSTDKVRALNNQFIPMMNGLKAGQEVTQAQLAELYNWGLLGMPLLRSMTSSLVEMGEISQETADHVNSLGAVGGILELQEQLEDGAFLAELLRDGMIEVGEEFAHLATTPISFKRLLEQISNIQLAGWKRSFELIVGNVVQAREVFGMLARIITPIVSDIHDWRNNMLLMWQDMGGREHLFGRFAYETQRITQDMQVWNPLFGRMITHAAAATKEFGEGVEYIKEMSEELGVIVRHFPDGTKEFTKWSDVAGEMVTYTTSLYHNLRVGSKYVQRSAQQLLDMGYITRRTAESTDAIYKMMPRIGYHGEHLGYSMQRVSEGIEGATIYGGYLTRDMRIWNDELQKYETIMAGTHVYMSTLSDYFSELTGVSDYTRVSLGAVGNIITALIAPFKILGNVISGVFGTEGEGLAAIVFLMTNAFYRFSQVLMLTVPIFDVVGAVLHVVLSVLRETVGFLLSFLPRVEVDFGRVYRSIHTWSDAIVDFLMAIDVAYFFDNLQDNLRNIWEFITNFSIDLPRLWNGMVFNETGLTRIGELVSRLGELAQGVFVVLAGKLGFPYFAEYLSYITDGIEVFQVTWQRGMDWLSRSTNRFVKTSLALLAEFFGFEYFAEQLRNMGSAWEAITTTMERLFYRLLGKSVQLSAGFTALLAAVGTLFGAMGFGLVYAYRWVVDWFTGVGRNASDGASGIERITGAFRRLGEMIRDVARAIGSVLGPIMYGFGSSVARFIDGITLNNIVTFLYALATFQFSQSFKQLPGILNKFIGIFGETGKVSLIEKITKPFKGLRKEFKDTVENITEGIDKLTQGTKFSPPILLQVAAALGALAASIWVIAQLDGSQIAISLGALTAGMAGIFAMVQLFKKNPIDGIKMKGIGASLMSFGAAMMMFAGAAKVLGSMEWQNMAQGVAGAAGLMAAFMLLNKKLGMPEMAPATIKASVASLLKMKLMTKQIKKLALVAVLLGAIPFPVAIQGVVALIALMDGLMRLTEHLATMPEINMSVLAMLKVLTKVLAGLGLVVIAVGSIPLANAVQGTAVVGALGFLIIKLAGMLQKLRYVNKAPAGAIATITTMTKVIMAMTPVVIALGTFSAETVAQGIIMTGVLGALMVGLVAMMNKFNAGIGDGAGMIKGAAAIGLLVVAMNGMVPLIITLGTLPWQLVAAGIGLFAAQLAVLLLAGAGAKVLAPGLLALSVAVISISTAFNTGVIAIGALAVALPALAIAVVTAATTLWASATVLEQFIKVVGSLLVTFIYVTITTLAGMGYQLGRAFGEIAVGVGMGLQRSFETLMGMLWNVLTFLIFGLTQKLEDNMRELVVAVGNMILTAIDEMALFIWANAPRIAASASLIVGALVEALLQAIVNLIRHLPFGNQVANWLEDNMMDGVRDANMQNAEGILAGRCEAMARYGFINGIEAGIQGASPALIAATEVLANDLGEPFYQMNGYEHGSRFIEDIASSAGVASGLLVAVAEDGAEAMEAPFAGLDGFNLSSMFSGGIISGLDIEQFASAGMDISDLLGQPIEELDGKELGEGFTMEVVDGVASVRGRITAISGEMAQEIINNFEAPDYFITGSGVALEFGEGMSQHQKALFEVGRQLGEAGFEGISDPEFHIAADEHMLEFVRGLNEYDQRVLNAGMRIADYAYDGLESIDTFILGQELGYGYAQGLNCVGGSSREVDMATRKQADLVAHNLRDVDGYNYGINIMGNYVAGIISTTGDVNRSVEAIINGQKHLIQNAEFTGEGYNAGVRFADGTVASQQFVNRAMSAIVNGCVETLNLMSYMYGEEGHHAMVQMAKGIEGEVDLMAQAVELTNDAGLRQAAMAIPEFAEIADNIVDTTCDTIENAAPRIGDSIREFFGTAIDVARTLNLIRSPSRVYRDIGNSIADGATAGVDDGRPGFLDSVRGFFNRGREIGENISYASAGRNAVDTAAQGTTGRENVFRNAVNTVMTNVRSWANGFNSSSIGREYVNDMRDGTTGRENHFRNGVNTVMTNVRTWANGFNSSSIGRNYTNRMTDGANERENHFRNNISNLMGRVRDGLNNFGSNAIGRGYVNNMTTGAVDRENHFRNNISNVLTRVRNGLNDFNTRSIGQGYVNNIATGATGRETHFRNNVRGVMERVRTNIGNIRFNSVGTNAMIGVEQGANNRSGTTNNVFRNIGNGLVRTFNNIFGISSPSRVFAAMAMYCMQGLERGFIRYDMDDTIKNVTRTITEPFANMRLEADIDMKYATHNILDRIKKGLDIQSRVRDFEYIGNNVMMNILDGLNVDDIESAANMICEAILAPFRRLDEQLNDLLDLQLGGNDVMVRPKLVLAGGYDSSQVYDPRGATYGDQYNNYEFGDTHVTINVPTGQAAEETMDQFRTKWKACMTETIRDFREVR